MTSSRARAVCLAADLHDIGWLEWEQQPEWNPRTGLPYDFMSTPRASHVRIWRRAARSLLSMNRYAALLTSLHGTGLYAGYDAQADPPEEADLVREFLRQEIAFQDTLIQLMEKDRFYRPFLEPRTLRRNRRLLAVWDLLSLHLCMGGCRADRGSRRPVAGRSDETSSPPRRSGSL
ncbi:MAG: hypothetical protein KatS3mg115_2144 [Candidatus Poribacteria bacterium]|nr:MAG: hypothetical protein KatS3mg115_2144 [Candidatus Poribacteria bacterium]